MSIEGTFISHLLELRTRLIRILTGLILGFLPCAYFARELYYLLAQPLLEKLPHGGQMIATEVTTPFFVPMKVAMMVAFLITLPHTLYQIWAFVAPGLYSHEKRLALPLVFSSSFLFLFGMSFAYFAALPLVFEFITYIAPDDVAVMTDIDKYLSFVLSMFIAFGITFEVPVFVMVCVRAGLISIAKLREIRHYVLVGAFVIGAIFTPPDVISQFLLAIPLYLLYEFGIFITAFTMKQRDETTKPTHTTQSKDGNEKSSKDSEISKDKIH